MQIDDKHFNELLELNSKLSKKHSFLSDFDTIEFVKKSKVLFVNRGLPGSGKSTLAREIIEIYGKENTVLCEGDDFFTNEYGVYKYQRDKVNECNLFTQNRVRSACNLGKTCVIADDTHLTYSDIEPYIQIAKEFNYILVLIEPRSSHKFDVDKLFTMCKHNVSKATIKKKLDDFQLIFPRYYAWFLNEIDSKYLCNLARETFEKCVNLSQNLSNDFIVLKKSLDPRALFEFRNELQLHCTSKFIGQNIDSNKDSRDYCFNLEVNENIGKVFSLELSGFSISDRTLVGDVRLKKNSTLWNNDLDQEEKMEVLDQTDLTSLKQDVFECLNNADRAHFTLGLEPGLKAYKSGIDLVRVKLLKKLFKYKKFECDDFYLFYLGNCFSYVKLKKPIKLWAIFSGVY
ncbi:unnamed protein product [Brachionus calyciflorus]|uniref:2',3'-cyclic-nucleotide 3'-phosphodiesterase n=1 Tax=Brachionus calyciflorus TaxID=104777 RepID=A0A814E0I0_9BILA|nr:unnamed protein product [Brachionus calyciflorus]